MKFLILFCLSVTPVIAGDFPTGWPWRSVSIIADPSGVDPEIMNVVLHSNVNVVRIYIQIKNVMKNNNITADQSLQLGMEYTDKIIDQLSKNNIGFVVAVQDFPTDSGKCSNKREIAYWRDENCLNQIYDFAEKTVKHFSKSGDSVKAFQFLNEPVVVNKLGQNKQPENWMQIYKNILNIVRKYDEKRFVMFSPGPWAKPTEYQNIGPFDDKKIIYNFHTYEPHGFTHQGIKGKNDNTPFLGEKGRINKPYPGSFDNKYWNKDTLKQYMLPIIRFQQKYNVPVSVGEFSAVRWAPGRDDYLRDVIDIFENNNFSWFYFSLGGWNGWDPRFEANEKDKNLTKGDFNSSKTWSLLNRYFVRNKK